MCGHLYCPAVKEGMLEYLALLWNVLLIFVCVVSLAPCLNLFLFLVGVVCVKIKSIKLKFIYSKNHVTDWQRMRSKNERVFSQVHKCKLRLPHLPQNTLLTKSPLRLHKNKAYFFGCYYLNIS